MQIDLDKELVLHLERIKALADEAGEDEGQSYASRASAMGALTNILRDITKTQAEVINLNRLIRIEAAVTEVLKQFLSANDFEQFLAALEAHLDTSDL